MNKKRTTINTCIEFYSQTPRRKNIVDLTIRIIRNFRLRYNNPYFKIINNNFVLFFKVKVVVMSKIRSLKKNIFL